MSICEPRSRFSPDTTSASALIWDFQPLDYEEPISVVSNHPVWNSVIIAALDDEDRELGGGVGGPDRGRDINARVCRHGRQVVLDQSGPLAPLHTRSGCLMNISHLPG